MTAQDVIKQMSVALHKDTLKTRGFRKSGNHWVRPDDWSRVVSLQNSKWNSATEAQFTINLGVHIPHLHELSGGLPVKGTLKEYNCDVRIRIGELFEYPRDHWWKVSGSESPDELVQEVSEALIRHGIPWLDRLSDYTAVANELKKADDAFMAALAFHLAGDATQAEASLADAFASASGGFLLKLRRVAVANSIPMPG
jgi:hypothetical protein